MSSSQQHERGARLIAPLRVLVVEDSADDTELLSRELSRSGHPHTLQRVATAEAMEAALDRQPWDVVIADYVLPRFSGLAALETVQRRQLDLPFIVVSGKIREETAVDAMKAGAHDYVFKENLSRLGPAVDREIRQAQMRHERREARAAAERAAAQNAFLAEASRVLGGELDLDATLRTVAHLAVPALADWCFVHLADPQQMRLAALAARDAGDEAWARDWVGRPSPLHGAGGFGPGAIIRARSALVSDGGPDFASLLDTVAPPETRDEATRRIAPVSLVCAPLAARGCSFGALTLVRSRSSRRLDDLDRALVEELALRCAMAIDSAMLLRDARTAVRVRDEFLGIASHELRTPVTTLSLLVEKVMLMLQHGDVTPEQLAKDSAVLLRQLRHLAALVEDLLDLSRIASGRLVLTFADADLATVVRDAVEVFRPRAEQAQCALQVRGIDAPVVGVWDAPRVAQVLTNMLDNAAKYGRGRPIEATLESDPARVRLVVRDHGIGIAPEDRDRIFGRFERAVSPRHYGGLGLGLFISRQLVDAHGGTMSVESKLGEGATFTVELPREPPPRKAKDA